MKSFAFQPGDRTGGFIVGLSNQQPVELQSQLPVYTECGRGPNITSGGRTYHVRCAANQPPARYVIILLPTQQFLHFCEVEVYGEGKLFNFLCSHRS